MFSVQMTHLDFFLTENKQKTSESMADMLQTVYEFPACVLLGCECEAGHCLDPPSACKVCLSVCVLGLMADKSS